MYLWTPPPVPLSGEFMVCANEVILLGAPQDYVLAACGPPTSSRQVTYAMRTGLRVIDVWAYERADGTHREVRFENGSVAAIDMLGALKR